MQNLVLILSLIFITANSNAQSFQFQWGFGMGDSSDAQNNINNQGEIVLTDNSNNVYNIGTFLRTVDFDPGANVYELNGGMFSTYISKYDSAGNFMWAKDLGEDVFVSQASIDDSNRLYLVGSISNTVIFDSTLSAIPDTLVTIGFGDIIVLKMNESGHIIWHRQFGDVNTEYGVSVQTDAEYNIYFMGDYAGAIDFDPSPNNYSVISNSNSGNIFIVKLNSSGDLVWAKNLGNTKSTLVSSSAILNNHLYISGTFEDTVDFSMGQNNNNVVGYDTITTSHFLMKMDTSGVCNWVKQNQNRNIRRSLLLLDENEMVYMSGQYSEQLILNNKETDEYGSIIASNIKKYGYICKRDSSGFISWVNILRCSMECDIRSITTDISGNILISGSFKDSLFYNPQDVSQYLISKNKGDDVFLISYTPLGNLINAVKLGDIGPHIANDVIVDNANNILLTGTFFGSIDLDPSVDSAICNTGSNSIFLAKYVQWPLSVQEVSEDERIMLYPNPTSGIFTIEIPEDAEIIIRNIYGQIMTKQSESKGNYQIDISSATNGIYFATVTLGKKTSTVKLIKNN